MYRTNNMPGTGERAGMKGVMNYSFPLLRSLLEGKSNISMSSNHGVTFYSGWF